MIGKIIAIIIVIGTIIILAKTIQRVWRFNKKWKEADIKRREETLAAFR